MNKEIMKIVNRVLSEEISGRISEVKNRLFENEGETCESCGSGDMYEGECMECGNMYEGNIQELGGMDDGHPRFGKKRLPNKMSIEDIEKLLRGDDDADADDDENDYGNLSMHNPYYGDDANMDDDDMDDDDKLNENFLKKFIDKLRGKNPKKIEKHEYDELTDKQAKQLYDDANKIVKNELNRTSDNDSVSAFYRLSIATDTMNRLKKHFTHIDFNNNELNNDNDKSEFEEIDEDVCEECGDTYEIELGEKLYGNQNRIDKNKNGRIDGEDFKMLRKEVYELELNDEEVFLFTENEIIDIIENIVLEEKKKSKYVSAQNVLKSSLGKSKKENDDHINNVVKKMKDYLKDMSKGKYEMNPKHFPAGNGELGEMEKMAYKASNSVEEYIENFTAAALENVDYDEIHPDEDWVTDNIVGSSRTGNNPDWGNAVETPNNKKRNEIRKNNLLGKLKKKAYNKADQPISRDTSGNKVDKDSKIMLKLESKENEQVISEITRMKNILTYTQKTQ